MELTKKVGRATVQVYFQSRTPNFNEEEEEQQPQEGQEGDFSYILEVLSYNIRHTR